jgi:hypothetical protein
MTKAAAHKIAFVQDNLLTDGSTVFDVVIREHDGHVITLGAESERAAHDIADAINDGIVSVNVDFAERHAA